MERTKLAIADHVYELALSVIENENYDMLDEGFLPSDVANAASNIFKNMLTWGKDTFGFKKDAFSIFTLGYNWKVSNSRPSYISCSDDNSTGVSRSEAPIFSHISGLVEDDVKDLLDMMNESWFLMKNA